MRMATQHHELTHWQRQRWFLSLRHDGDCARELACVKCRECPAIDSDAPFLQWHTPQEGAHQRALSTAVWTNHCSQ